LCSRTLGIRDESVRVRYPPYIRVSVRPIDRMRSFTRYAPELVDPPSQTSSEFAAASSDGTIISWSNESRCEPGAGIPR